MRVGVRNTGARVAWVIDVAGVAMTDIADGHYRLADSLMILNTGIGRNQTGIVDTSAAIRLPKLIGRAGIRREDPGRNTLRTYIGRCEFLPILGSIRDSLSVRR